MSKPNDPKQKMLDKLGSIKGLLLNGSFTIPQDEENNIIITIKRENNISKILSTLPKDKLKKCRDILKRDIDFEVTCQLKGPLYIKCMVMIEDGIQELHGRKLEDIFYVDYISLYLKPEIKADSDIPEKIINKILSENIAGIDVCEDFASSVVIHTEQFKQHKLQLENDSRFLNELAKELKIDVDDMCEYIINN